MNKTKKLDFNKMVEKYIAKRLDNITKRHIEQRLSSETHILIREKVDDFLDRELVRFFRSEEFIKKLPSITSQVMKELVYNQVKIVVRRRVSIKLDDKRIEELVKERLNEIVKETNSRNQTRRSEEKEK